MVEFGDEFIVQSYRIPWLIWIQLLVMILIVILLYFGFAVFNSDLSITTSSAAAPPLTQLDKPSSSHNQRPKVEDNRSRADVGTSGVLIREDNEIQEESSPKGSMLSGSFHPCNYIRLVRRAFLKCLGLDSSSECSTNHQHNKQD